MRVQVKARSLRQQVMPEPRPISCGSVSQGMPLFSTERIPVGPAGPGGRPPSGLGFSGGRGGSMIPAARLVYVVSP